MPPGVRLVHYEPKEPPVQLSNSTITDTQLFIRTTLAQLDAHLRGLQWQSGNWGLAGLLERLSACGCIVEIDDNAS